MKKSCLVLGFVTLATVNAAIIPPPISEAAYHAFRDPTLDIEEDAKAGLRPYNIDVYIAEDNNRDTIRSKRLVGSFGLGGSRAQTATYSLGGGYGGLGYPGGFGGPAFGSPVGSAFGSPVGGGGFGGLGGYGGLGGGFSGSAAQSSSSAFGTSGGIWG